LKPLYHRARELQYSQDGELKSAIASSACHLNIQNQSNQISRHPGKNSYFGVFQLKGMMDAGGFLFSGRFVNCYAERSRRWLSN